MKRSVLRTPDACRHRVYERERSDPLRFAFPLRQVQPEYDHGQARRISRTLNSRSQRQGNSRGGRQVTIARRRRSWQHCRVKAWRLAGRKPPARPHCRQAAADRRAPGVGDTGTLSRCGRSQLRRQAVECRRRSDRPGRAVGCQRHRGRPGRHLADREGAEIATREVTGVPGASRSWPEAGGDYLRRCRSADRRRAKLRAGQHHVGEDGGGAGEAGRGGRHHRADRGRHCQADEPPRTQRGHRSSAGRRAWPRLRRGCRRGAQSCRDVGEVGPRYPRAGRRHQERSRHRRPRCRGIRHGCLGRGCESGQDHRGSQDHRWDLAIVQQRAAQVADLARNGSFRRPAVQEGR